MLATVPVYDAHIIYTGIERQELKPYDMESECLQEIPTNDAKNRKVADPLLQTARGKLQTRRSKLNDEINKELRLRAGAENLFRATGNKKLKELVAVELSFFNSNIQLLKEELSELNSSVNIYQHDNCIDCVPMVPLGLKETREVDFTVPIKDFILEHYSENGNLYEPQLQELMDFRQAIRVPVRNDSGVAHLMSYYNQLTCLERRFYPSGRNLGIYFHWYDSLTGVPYCQRTIGFEKGSILFNVGALYTQIACKQDRKSLSGVNAAIENFQKAAGAFQYLVTYFSHAPSMDMQPDTLHMLIKLMKAQSQECMFERLILEGVSTGLLNQLKVAKMAAKVSNMYNDTHQRISAEPVKAYVPFSWISMLQVKSQFYKAQAHYYVALAMLEQDDSNEVEKLQELVKVLDLSNITADIEETTTVLPLTSENRKTQGKAHYRESIVLLEDALNTHDLCKQLRKIDLFHGVLRQAYERAMKKFEGLEEEDDFSDLVMVPTIVSDSEPNVEGIFPDFSQHRVMDFFHALGPLTVFSAKFRWSAPRTVNLEKDPKYGYGFSVRGDSPVKVNDVESHSNADVGGIRVGDYIVAISDKDTKWSLHDDVVQLVRNSGDKLNLKVVTPMGENHPSEIPVHQQRRASIGAAPSNGINDAVHNNNNNNNNHKNTKSRNRLSAPWMFIRRNSNKSLNKMDKKSSHGELTTR